MNPTPRLFRTLILLSLVCVIASICVTYLAPWLVPEPLRIADENLSEGMLESMSLFWLILLIVVCIGLVVASIAGCIGMFMFKPWARPLNVALAFSSFIIWPFLGYNLTSGWSQALSDCAILLEGAVISMAYFSPISERFLRNKG